jgi:Circadian oscillating protein COP23
MNLNQSFKTLVSLATTPGAIALLGMSIIPTNVNALDLQGLNLDGVTRGQVTHGQQLPQVISQRNDPPEVIINDPSSTPSGSSRSSRRTSNADTRFNCELVNGEYTVMYYPESRPDQGYAWAIPSALGGGWTPEKRCDAITARFESYREDGLLELTTGEENGYDTICVTTQVDPRDCRLVLTVPPGQDPQLTRDLIFDNLLVADDGGSTQGVYTFGDRQGGGGDILGEITNVLNGGGGKKRSNNSRKASPENINLRPFLDTADGGTGQQLKQLRSNPATPKPRNVENSERKPDLFK